MIEFVTKIYYLSVATTTFISNFTIVKQMGQLLTYLLIMMVMMKTTVTIMFMVCSAIVIATIFVISVTIVVVEATGTLVVPAILNPSSSSLEKAAEKVCNVSQF